MTMKGIKATWERDEVPCSGNDKGPQRSFRGWRVAAVVAGGLAVLAVQGHAVQTVPFGTATGGITVNYNNNLVVPREQPANQAYLQAQFTQTNTNGAGFTFSSAALPPPGNPITWYNLFSNISPSQFGLDLIVPAPTYDGSMPMPTLVAKDNVNGTPGGATPAGPVTWAINDYKGPSPSGPQFPGNAITNSLFRGGTGAGDGVTLTVQSLSNPTPGVWTMTVAGELQSDGIIHWYTPSPPGPPHSQTTNFELTGKFFYSGTLTYNAPDPVPGSDFYAGTINITAEVVCADRFVSATGTDTLPGGAPNNCRTAGVPCKTINYAITMACDGDTVNVAVGTYVEQVEISKPLTLSGTGGPIIQSPASLALSFTTPGNVNKPVVYVHGIDNVTIEGLTIDGLGRGNANSRFVGIGYSDAGGHVTNVEIKNIEDTPFSGAQHGIGLYAYSAAGTARSLEVDDVNVHDFQKGGMVYMGANLLVNVHESTVTGIGDTGVTAQNGIQVSGGAQGAITQNTVSGISYTGASWGATAILGAGAGGTLAISDNIISTSMAGIDVDTAADITGNHITGHSLRDWGIIAWGPATISGNEIASNGYAIYTVETVDITGNTITGFDGENDSGIIAEGSWTITDNTVSGVSYGVEVVGNNNTFSGNVVQGSVNYGVYVEGTGNSFTCNRVTDNGVGFYFDVGYCSVSYAACVSNSNCPSGQTCVNATAGTPNTLSSNAIYGNSYFGVDASVVTGPPDIEATGNWWGCEGGPGVLGCDTKTGPVDTEEVSPLSAPPVCVSCTGASDGAPCNDDNACTQTDTCQSGTCTGSNPVVCTADQCHDPGTCNTGTGVCSAPTNKTNGTSCNDGNACTQTDTCQSGTCTGSNPVVCTASDQCHSAGTCNTTTGQCSNPSNAGGPLCHDIVVQPLQPLNVSIPSGSSAVTKTLSVTVRDADPLPPRGTHDNVIVQLVATSTDCPAGTIVGIPNFGHYAAATPDTVWVDASYTRAAKVALNISRAAFTSFNRKAPTRCTLTFTATTVSPAGSVDLTPENSSATVELNVVDKNDSEQTTKHETVIKSMAPLKVTLNKGTPSITKKLPVQVGNADYKPVAEKLGDLITVTVDPGDCPPSLFSGVDFNNRTPGVQNSTIVKGGATASGSLPLTINASAFDTLNANSPTRCTAELHASGPSNPETPPLDPTNNTTKLVIDVIDKNDF